jgi:hypothetical protein
VREAARSARLSVGVRGSPTTNAHLERVALDCELPAIATHDAR